MTVYPFYSCTYIIGANTWGTLSALFFAAITYFIARNRVRNYHPPYHNYFGTQIWRPTQRFFGLINRLLRTRYVSVSAQRCRCHIDSIMLRPLSPRRRAPCIAVVWLQKSSSTSQAAADGAIVILLSSFFLSQSPKGVG